MRVIQEKGKALSRFFTCEKLNIYTTPDYALKTAKIDYIFYNVLIECPKIDFGGGCWVSGSAERQKGALIPDFISLLFSKGGFRKAMKIRRVVTENNENGKSKVKWDSEIESQPGRPGFEHVPLWATDRLPVQLTDEDPNTWDLGTSLANGSVFRICQYEPGVTERWHSTDTIDYGIVLAGELWMQLDEEEVHLKSGDVVIQRGTIHNWENRGAEPCIVAFILIASEGGKTTGWS